MKSGVRLELLAVVWKFKQPANIHMALKKIQIEVISLKQIIISRNGILVDICQMKYYCICLRPSSSYIKRVAL